MSVAGKRGGITASRSGLFFEAMRIVRVARPSYFIFENVKGLFSSDEGRDWLTVLREIADAGYDGQWQLLNTRWFLPHDRERIYFTGYRRGEPRPEIFPFEEGDKEFIGTHQEGRPEGVGVARSLDANYHKGPDGKRTHLILRDNWGGNIKQRVKGIDQPVWTLGGSETVIYEQGHGFNKGGLKKICPTLSINSFERNNFLMGEDSIRALTPLEFERLSGFPDNWTSGVSDTQRYKMLGNAVSLPIVQIIGERLLNAYKTRK